jgi:L-rhamnose isomerase
MAKEIVRCNGLDRTYMALDYFDASINRISAWTVGFRSWQKALLSALLTPNEMLADLQNSANMTKLMVMQEEMKTLPFGDIWIKYCEECGVAADEGWLDNVLAYENEVLANR